MLDKSIRIHKNSLLDANLSDADVDTAEGRKIQLQLQMVQDECQFLADGVIFYLEQVSNLRIEDDLYVLHHMQLHQEVSSSYRAASRGKTSRGVLSTADIQHFKKRRNELFDTVGSLSGLTRKIICLDDDLVKRAAATQVLRRILDRRMFSPFATLTALFDGVAHLMLIISFRMGPAQALFHLSRNDETFKPQIHLLSNAIIIFCVCWFGTKKFLQQFANRALSEDLFQKDFYSFWGLLDWVPLVMVLFCSISVDTVLIQRANSDVDDDITPFILRTAIAITTVRNDVLT